MRAPGGAAARIRRPQEIGDGRGGNSGRRSGDTIAPAQCIQSSTALSGTAALLDNVVLNGMDGLETMPFLFPSKKRACLVVAEVVGESHDEANVTYPTS